jgi:hypothetical protein
MLLGRAATYCKECWYGLILVRRYGTDTNSPITGKADIAANAKIHTSVTIGPPEQPPLPGFGLRVTIEVEGVEDDKIIADTHEVYCDLFLIT